MRTNQAEYKCGLCGGFTRLKIIGDLPDGIDCSHTLEVRRLGDPPVCAGVAMRVLPSVMYSASIKIV